MDSENRDRNYQFFIEEAPELLQVIEASLLDLQQNNSPAEIHNLMRAAHSLKGGAATIGLDAIETIAHRLENIFRALYGDIEIDTELETLLLEAYDCLGSPLQQLIATGNLDAQSSLATADSVLIKIEFKLKDALEATDNYLPSSNDLGVDLVSSLFEMDVAQGIQHLADLIAQAQDGELAIGLRAQAEVFIGFAEMLDLPGFGAIASATMAALDANPEAVKTIANLAFDNFLTAKEQVLAGDRTDGGVPSDMLLEFSQKTELRVIGKSSEKSLNESKAIAEPKQLNSADNGKASNLVLVSSNSAVTNTQSSSAQPQLQVNASVRQQPKANLKIQVDSQRLEKINNLIGELVISRNSQVLQHEQFELILNKLQNQLKQFQRLSDEFREISDREISDRVSVAPTQNSDNNTAFSEDFDPLEMDRYNKTYSLSQELVEETIQFEEAVDDIVLYKRQSDDTINKQQKTLSQLREELMWARMLPLERVLGSFPRGLRDLSVKYHKPVKLSMTGTDILVDKGILKELHDPLLHLLRNAFDHGVEPPEARLKQGKNEFGQINICAYYQGDRTSIEIRDDGRGLDIEKIACKAIDRGWLSVEQLANTNQKELLDFIFEPGFSTTEQVNELSGRGVGLDVVRSQLEKVDGSVSVNSTPGKGTTFTLSLPLTQTIAPMMVCSVNSSAIAIPAAIVREVIMPQAEKISRSQNLRMLSWQEQLLPIYRLDDLLEYRYSAPICPRKRAFNHASSLKTKALPLLIISQGEQNFALETEGFSKEQELVIKPLTGAIKTPNYYYGHTVLGDGSLIPAIAPVDLLAYVRQKSSKNRNQYNLTALSKEQDLIPTVLAVDDSAMMRRILTHTLEKEGYRVLIAKDGWEALELLEQSSQVQLIVTDLEMPNLNGLELLHRLRQDSHSQLAQIPVAMLTSRNNDKHRAMAMSFGAEAYLTKPYIEQDFLAELRKILGKNQQYSPEIKNSPLKDLSLNSLAI